MGRASSTKKVARAARASRRPGASRNLGWPLFLGAVVLLGVGLVGLSIVENDEASAEPPRLGDHWHAAYGIYLCGEVLPPLNDAGPDLSGLHTHGDGLIHIHPTSTSYTGPDADLGAWADTVGVDLGDDSLEVPERDGLENGDDCGGEPGEVQVKVWRDEGDDEGRLLDGEFGDYAPKDGSIVTIAFAPKGADVPKPPSVGTVPTDIAPPEGGSPSPPVPGGSASTLPDTSPTSAARASAPAPAPPETTPTSVPPPP